MPQTHLKPHALLHSYSLMWVIILSGFILNSHFIVHIDIFWLTHEAEAFFSGKHYIQHFIDPNPPLILFLYEPINWLKHYWHATNESIIILTYTYILISASLARCYHLIQSIKEKELPSFFAPFLAIVLVFLPMKCQGQRECLILIFSMPYLISALSNKSEELNRTRWIDTSAAAIGFMLKLQYLCIPLVIELILRARGAKHRKHWLVFLIGLASYVIFIAYKTPEYYQQLLPFISHYYIRHFAYTPWKELIQQPNSFGPFVGIICSTALVMLSRNRTQGMLLACLIINTAITLIPQQLFIYHTIPMLIYWCLLSALFWQHMFKQKKEFTQKLLFTCLSILNTLFLLFTIAFHISVNMSEKEYYHLFLSEKTPENAQRIMPLFITSTRSVLSTFVQHRTNCSRFSGLWMTPYFTEKNRVLTRQENIDKKHITSWLQQDILHCQPDLILLPNDPKALARIQSFLQDDAFFGKLIFSQKKAFSTQEYSAYSYPAMMNADALTETKSHPE